MIQFNLTASSLRLEGYTTSDTFSLSVKYNEQVTKKVEVRGLDNLYALQYLVNRAIQKLKS